MFGKGFLAGFLRRPTLLDVADLYVGFGMILEHRALMRAGTEVRHGW